MIALVFALTVSVPLIAQTPIIVPGGPGKFDFMNVDSLNRYAFACQPGKAAFTVIGLDTDKIQSIPAGVELNGIDTDAIGKKLYAAGPGKILLRFDMLTWKITGQLKLEGPGDSVIFDARHHKVLVDNDDGSSLWIVNPDKMQVEDTVRIKEAPEVMALDLQRNRVFQNIKSSNSIQVIDLDAKRVTREFALGSLIGPHGLAEDRALGKLFSVGKNGKLVILKADSGEILQTLDVVKNSDQIAYDSQLKRLYIPGNGELQTIQITPTGATIIGSVTAPQGCHSITVDTKTHCVWVAYTDEKQSCVMKYVAN